MLEPVIPTTTTIQRPSPLDLGRELYTLCSVLPTDPNTCDAPDELLQKARVLLRQGAVLSFEEWDGTKKCCVSKVIKHACKNLLEVLVDEGGLSLSEWKNEKGANALHLLMEQALLVYFDTYPARMTVFLNLIDYLGQEGAFANCLDHEGSSVLHYLVDCSGSYGQQIDTVVEKLVAMGANIFSENHQNASPLEKLTDNLEYLISSENWDENNPGIFDDYIYTLKALLKHGADLELDQVKTAFNMARGIKSTMRLYGASDEAWRTIDEFCEILRDVADTDSSDSYESVTEYLAPDPLPGALASEESIDTDLVSLVNSLSDAYSGTLSSEEDADDATTGHYWKRLKV